MCKFSSRKCASDKRVLLRKRQLVEEGKYLLTVVSWEGNALRGLHIFTSFYLSRWSCYEVQGVDMLKNDFIYMKNWKLITLSPENDSVGVEGRLVL